MNKGLSFVTGKYVLFLNSGDALCRDLEDTLNQIKYNSHIDVFYSDIGIINAQSKKIIINYHPLLLLTHCLNHQNMIVKTTHLNDGYDLSYKYTADVKWQIENLSRLSVEKIAEPIAYYDLNGVSSNKSRKIVERIWRERIIAHYRSSSHRLVMKILTVTVSLIIYLIKLTIPNLLSRTAKYDQ